jgi:DNA invertase Pin-like site-specific DNA recombinase
MKLPASYHTPSPGCDRPSAAPVRALIYARKSPNGWDDEGCSIEMQVERCRAYCMANELQVVGEIPDMLQPSKHLNRPGIQECFRRIAGGEAEALVIFRLDRLTRSLTDLLALVEGPFGPGRAQLHSLNEKLDTSCATGRLMVKLLGSINEWQREIIGENTKATLQTMKNAGHPFGRAPYGWRYAVDDSGRRMKPNILEDDPQEQRAIRIVRELAGEHTSEEIAARIQIPRRGGKAWNRQAVDRILSRASVPGSMDEARTGQEE